MKLKQLKKLIKEELKKVKEQKGMDMGGNMMPGGDMMSNKPSMGRGTTMIPDPPELVRFKQSLGRPFDQMNRVDLGELWQKFKDFGYWLDDYTDCTDGDCFW